jgi:calcium-dependent protein kinase
MEICHGGDLFSRLSYSEHEASRIVQQILSAAAYLHDRNIVHRDLKYQNILFVDKDHLDIKIIDFGLATRQDSSKRNGYSPKCGTLYTMSPETVTGKPTNASTDMWSIGVIAYMLLCNQKPFWGESRYAVSIFNSRHSLPLQQISHQIGSFLLYLKYDFIYRAEIEYQILTKEITLDDTDSIWNSISKDAKQFVSSLLQRIPERRPTAKEALQHNFIQRQGSISSPKNDSGVLNKLHDSIQRFIASSDFRKIILQMIASRYPSEEILDLTHIFTGFDSNNEGVLYFSDFKALLSGFHHSELELQEMFGRIVRFSTLKADVLYIIKYLS